MIVPVFNVDNEPLMPTKPSRARKWIKARKATPFWKKGVFCVRLNERTEEEITQDIAVGIDPGSKKEAFTIKSHSQTYLNIQADAVTWVKKAMEVRKFMRRSRRQRKTPYRKQRLNRKRNNGLAPSTKARWQWKLRVINWLRKLFPISHFCVEDIKAETKGKKKWDQLFSPLQIGKKWFYSELEKLNLNLTLKLGFETKKLRDKFGLNKTKEKMSKNFDAHCVDSWVLSNSVAGGHSEPDNKEILYLKPLHFNRRQLHMSRPAKGGIRRRQGGTMSLGLKRGSLVKHPKHGLCYVGGYMNNRITLHDMAGNRISRDAKVAECNFLCYNNWTCNK